MHHKQEKRLKKLARLIHAFQTLKVEGIMIRQGRNQVNHRVLVNINVMMMT